MTKKINPKKITNVSQIVHRRGEHPKFIKQNVKLLSANMLPYYAEFNTYINYYESTNLPTCGVNITKEGMNFYWNRKFVDSLTNEEALFLIIHEDFHLLFDHTKRSIHYDKELSNVVQDMIINQIIRDEMMVRQSLKDHISIPKDHDEYFLDKEGEKIIGKDGKPIKNPNFGNNTALFIPKEYPDLNLVISKTYLLSLPAIFQN